MRIRCVYHIWTSSTACALYISCYPYKMNYELTHSHIHMCIYRCAYWMCVSYMNIIYCLCPLCCVTHKMLDEYTHTGTCIHIYIFIGYVNDISTLHVCMQCLDWMCVSYVFIVCVQDMYSLNVCMGWLSLVGSLKIQVSFAGYSLFYRALLQKRPMFLESLQIVATSYNMNDVYITWKCGLRVYDINIWWSILNQELVIQIL